MGNKLAPKEAELYRRVDEILHYKWDPIGISNEPGARDEYHSYLPKVYKLTQEANFTDKIADYLDEVVSENIGLNSNHEHSLEIAVIITDWVSCLRDN